MARRPSLQEALDLTELDLDARRGSVLVRRGKGGRRREVGMDDRGFEELEPWLRARQAMPVGPLFCVIDGRTRGRAWHSSAAREACGAGRRASALHAAPAPPRPRARSVREGVPLNVIQRQLGHRNLGVTSIYLRGIDPTRSSTPSTPAARR
ncbi:tyrosine-type recombinase/integrase [Solirubrobacter ginsenosidimutans]|uniref:tyrosine-type recombinase/integrase n=1 Tax=Solirubrobacter ginsenosidimutans TaxID=490573 RepID=UPI0035591532